MTKSLESNQPRTHPVLKRIMRSPRYAEESLRGEISDVIKDAMESQGVTRAELARRLNTSRAFVTQILRGDNNFEVSTLARIGKALGIEWRLTWAKKGKR